jgi:integrase
MRTKTLSSAWADGSHLDPDVVSLAFERLVRQSGLPRIRFYDLRHTHATLGLAAHIHPKVMSERLGHSSITITLDLYSHAIPALGAEAADRIAGIVDAAI